MFNRIHITAFNITNLYMKRNFSSEILHSLSILNLKQELPSFGSQPSMCQ